MWINVHKIHCLFYIYGLLYWIVIHISKSYCIHNYVASSDWTFGCILDLRREMRQIFKDGWTCTRWKGKDRADAGVSLPMQEMKEMQVWSLGCGDHLEKEIVAHPSIFAWGIPRTEEPGGLQPIGLQKNWTWLSDWATAKVFSISASQILPGESQGWQSLVGCRLWGHTESDKPEATWQWQQWPIKA